MNRRTLVNFGRSKFELSTAHKKFDFWTGPEKEQGKGPHKYDKNTENHEQLYQK